MPEFIGEKNFIFGEILDGGGLSGGFLKGLYSRHVQRRKKVSERERPGSFWTILAFYTVQSLRFTIC